jgi:hypothetical protein
MKLCRDDLGAYASAAALLAIHSAISYNDALLIKLSGRRSRSQAHEQAIKSIGKACGIAKIRPQGIEHLKKLLGAKTDVSYGDRQVDRERAEALCILAERFQAWAEGLLHR